MATSNSSITNLFNKYFVDLDLNNKPLKHVFTGLAVVGTYFFSRNVWGMLKGFWKYCMVQRMNLIGRYGGGWALITGASDGIGKQYCKELARSGFNIVLMARDETKLDAVAKELREQHTVQTKIIVYDFSELSTQDSAQLLKTKLEVELKDIDVSILVNNVGCAKFASLDTHTVWDSMR